MGGAKPPKARGGSHHRQNNLELFRPEWAMGLDHGFLLIELFFQLCSGECDVHAFSFDFINRIGYNFSL